jgi:hypothetical protein
MGEAQKESTMIVKALSIRQPWAVAITKLGKDVENRIWKIAPKYRGLVLIHAASALTRAEYEGASFPQGSSKPPFEQLERGGIVGAAELYDIVPPPPKPATRAEAMARLSVSAGLSGWAQHRCMHLMLRNAVALPFRPLKGMLGLFSVELTPAEQVTLRAVGLLPAAAMSA